MSFSALLQKQLEIKLHGTALDSTFSSLFFSGVETIQSDLATGDVGESGTDSDLLENMVRVVIFNAFLGSNAN